jgi:DNA-binding MurR/RpiR family transcriptional regulator
MRLHEYDEKDLVIAIAFPRYFRETIEVARYAKRKKVRVLAITDSPRSPLAAFADVSVYVHAERGFGANSDSTVLAVLESLVSAVTHKTPDALKRYRALTEAILPWCEVPARDKNG